MRQSTKTIRSKTNITIVDKLDFSPADMEVSVKTYMWVEGYEMLALPESTVELTVASAKDLIVKLQNAIALVGNDFIVHDSNGKLTVDSNDYDSLDDYNTGIVSAE